MSLQLNPFPAAAATRPAAAGLMALADRHALADLQAPPPSALKRLLVKLLFTLGVATGLLIVVGVAQHVAPDGYRPAQIIGHLLGDGEAAKIAAALEAERAKVAALKGEEIRLQQQLVITQAQAQEMVIAAQSQAQQEVAAMQGRVQIATAAYASLYERANQLAMLYAQTAQGFIHARTEMVRANQGGAATVANLADLGKGIAMLTGNADMYQRAEAIRRQATDSQMRELDDAMSRAIPQLDARAFVAQGLPDPAVLTAAMVLEPRTLRPAAIEMAASPPVLLQPYR